MQADLFGQDPVPPGFSYAPDLVDPAAQIELTRHIAASPLEPFDFHGFKANRRVHSYEWRYDFGAERLARGDDLPDWLLEPRRAAAAFAGVPAEAFVQVLVSEYAPGAGIGWHKDKRVFGQIVGVSLGAACDLRLRRPLPGGKWQRMHQFLAPGSMYLLSGAVRSDWEHSIAPVEQLRYSLTFRTLMDAS